MGAKRTSNHKGEQGCSDTGHREMPTDRSTPPRAPEGAILRLALAMRGGVSLAVWIGGAMRELDRLQRPDAFTRALLEATVFRRAEIDILTGASAGGLNAAIGGYSMARDQPVKLRDVWIQVADIDRLLEPSKDGSRASVLDGDFFLRQVVRQIRKIDRSPASHRCGHASQTAECPPTRPVQMFLASTVFGGLRVTQDVDPLYSDRRREAYFRFRHLAKSPAFTDLDESDAIDQVGTAARTSASFPAAFEPVEIGTDTFRGRLHLPTDEAPPTMRMLDGGIVDNIPVARAIQAVASAPANDPVRRWVVYLHPNPDGLVTRPDRPRGGTSPTIPAVIRDALASLNAETLLDDLDILERHNREADAQKVQRNSLFAAALSRPPRSPDELLGSVDAYRIYALLDDPGSNLAWIPIGQTAPGSPLASCTDDQRFRLRARISTEVRGRAAAGCATLRPFARVARLAHFTIEWIRWAEQHGASFQDQRRVTYDVLLLAEIIDAAISRSLLELVSDPVLNLSTILDETERSKRLRLMIEDIQGRAPTDCERMVPLPDDPLLRPCSSRVLSELARGILPDDPVDNGVRVSDELLALLTSVGVDILRETRDVEPEHDSAFTLLSTSIRNGKTWSARAATSLRCSWLQQKAVRSALLTIDAAGAGLHRGFARGTPQRLEYIRISGAAGTPLARSSSPLDALPSFRNIDLRGDGTIDPDQKLSGNKLGSFSAFLSPRFRANDWMWGRMDAATEIVNLLFRPEYLSDQPAAKLIELVGCIVRQPFERPVDVLADEDIEAAEAICADLWSENEDQIVAEITAATRAARDADCLPVTRRVIQARWHLELAVSEMPSVIEERLDRNEAPPTWPEADAEGESPKARIQRLLSLYEDTPRTVRALWGRRDTTGLGVRTVRATARGLTPTQGIKVLPRRIVLGVPMLIGVAAALSRGAFLIAWNALVNIVFLPRLHWPWWPILGTLSAIASLAFWLKLVRRKPGEWRDRLTGIVVIGLVGLGLASLSHDWLHQPQNLFQSWNPRDVIDTSALWGPVLAVAMATAVATLCLWIWARRWAMLTATFGSGLLMGIWVVIGAWEPTSDSWVARSLEGIRSMWVPATMLVVLLTWLALSLRVEARPTPEDLE